MDSARPIGLGIIGGGGAFGRFIAAALPLVPGVALAAVGGSNEERTRRAAADLGVPRWTIHYPELIADPTVDLVVIASPPHLHAPMALDALAAGKAIFVEKPLAVALDDGIRVVEEARARRLPATIDYVMRYSPVYQAALAVLRGGALGPLRRLEFRNDAGDEGLDAGHWFWDRAKSGGILVEHGVHFFDVYGALAGADPAEIHGSALTRAGTDQQDVVHADVRYANGVFGSFTHAFDKPSRLEAQEGRLVCDRGSMRITGWTPTRLELDGLVDEEQRAALAAIPGLRLEVLEELSGAAQQMRGRGQPFRARCRVRGEVAPPHDSQELYRRAVAAALADVVATMRDPSHRQAVTLEDGLRSLAVACVAAGTAGPADLHRVLRLIEAPAA
jgi:predicted dehydrogenase